MSEQMQSMSEHAVNIERYSVLGVNQYWISNSHSLLQKTCLLDLYCDASQDNDMGINALLHLIATI